MTPVLALVLAACSGGSSDSARDAGPRTDAAPLPSCAGDAPFPGEPTLPLEIGARVGDVFTAWSDGTEVPFVWGPQGGTMIVPTLRADAALGSGDDEPCVVIEITNAEPGGGEVFADFRTLRMATFASREGELLVVRDLFDQLGTIEIPRGTPLDLEIVVRGRRAAARGRVRLSVVPPGAPLPPECEALPVRGEGCRYREIPATARIVRVTPAGSGDGTRCPLASDGLVVEAEIAVMEGLEACTSVETRTERLLVAGAYLPSSACAESAGIVEGAVLEVQRSEIFAGSCSPLLETVPALSACFEACVGAR